MTSNLKMKCDDDRAMTPQTCFEKDASKRFSACASRISFGGCTEIKLLAINKRKQMKW